MDIKILRSTTRSVRQRDPNFCSKMSAEPWRRQGDGKGGG